MADHAIVLTENVDQIVWWIEDWSTLWSLFEVLVVTLLLGFVLGYMCAVKFGKARGKRSCNPQWHTDRIEKFRRHAIKWAAEQDDWSTVNVYVQKKACDASLPGSASIGRRRV